MTEIIREETRERAQLVRVESYEIRLDLTRGPEIFGSESVIRFGCAQPGATTYVDLIAERVREVVLNGVSIDPAEAVSAGRVRLPGLAASNEVTIVADCRYSGDGTGLHRSVDSADGKVYLYTKFEPAYARRVFANFEQPDLKAPFTFHITAPGHWTVLSNQPAGGTEPAAGGGGTVWHFPPTPLISTYLTAVVAGEYEVVRDSHTTPRGQQIPLSLACRASLAAHLDAADILATTRKGFDFFTELFQGDYPFAQYGQAFVPEYSTGATENVGCVVISDGMLFPAKVTDAMHELRSMVILHEMAHMWFGDLVTMAWWDDLWLNESFAEFSGSLATAEATRFTDAWTTFSISRKTWAYSEDQLPSTHPIAADVPTLSQAVANFDGISYAKGASVLRQLVAKVGRENFFAATRAYFAEHAFGNATLQDLLRALESSSGVRLADWSRAWLETAGPNTLRAHIETGPDNCFTSFAVLQEAAGQHPTLRPHHLAIGLYDRDAAGELTRTRRVEVDIAGARTEIPALTGERRPDLILLNDDDLSFAIIRFDARSLTTLTESVGAMPASLSRTVCWSSLIDMTRQAELSRPAFIKILTTSMGRESSISVLQTLLSVAGQLILTGDPQDAAAGRSELAAAALTLLHDATPGSDHQLAWAQLLSWTATTPEQLDLADRLAAGAGLPDGAGATGLADEGGPAGETELPGLKISAGLRWALLRRLAAVGRADDARIDAALAADPTDSGERAALSCRAAIPDAAHKAAAWQLLAESDQLGTSGAREVVTGFEQPEHAGLLTPYTERYFEVLPRIWAARGEHFRMLLGHSLFPVVAASPELLARIDEFLAAEDRDPAMARMLIERRDMVDRALRSRALPR